jgi:hypothetical protein
MYAVLPSDRPRIRQEWQRARARVDELVERRAEDAPMHPRINVDDP